MTGRRWEERAIAFLESNAETMPLKMLVNRFNREAKRHGWTERTEIAIAVKLGKLGFSHKPDLDNFPAQTLSKKLGIPYDRVRRWIKTGCLPFKQVGFHKIVSLNAFKEFCDRYPEKIGEIDTQTLAWFIGEEKAIALKARIPTHRPGLPTPVKCVATGERFASMTEAARQNHITRQSIGRAIKKEISTGGLRFIPIKEVSGR